MIRHTFVAAAVFIAGLSSTMADTFTFSNTNTIVINDSDSPPTAASPYPSTNLVSGIAGSSITKVTARIYGFAHTFPSDVSILLVGPGRQNSTNSTNSILMAQVGGSTRTSVTNLDLTFDDDAASNLPLENQLVSGTFKPTTNTFSFSYPSPAPSTDQIMGASLGNFKNTDPNGTWNLFVVDLYPGDSGVITGGWSLTITTSTTVPALLSISKAGTNAILSWTNTAAGYTLQAAASLSSTTWTNVSPAPVVVSGNYTVTNAMTNNSTFYRLAK